ncbi:hypothetical protein GEMRC1_009806 [Eukaryota sp. GEM-RC1]
MLFFSDETFTVLCDIIKNNVGLTFIDLSHCELTDGNLVNLIDVFEFNAHSSLTIIALQKNCISSQGAVSLAKMLTRDCSITTINLSDNFIDSEGALALEDALRINCTITVIFLNNNFLDTQTVELITKKPNDRINVN